MKLRADWDKIQIVDIDNGNEVCVLERSSSIGWEVPAISDVIVLNGKERWEIVSREFHPDEGCFDGKWVLGAVRA